jgi:hypothetical protein
MRIKQVILLVFWIVAGYNLWDLVIGTKNIPWRSEAITLLRDGTLESFGEPQSTF